MFNNDSIYEKMTDKQVKERSRQLSIFVRKTLDELYSITPELTKAEATFVMSLIIGGMCAEQNVSVESTIEAIHKQSNWAINKVEQIRKSKDQN